MRGRLEVFHDGVWGSICNRNWDWKAQNVACQQLGYIRAIHHHRYKYNDGPAPKVWLNSVKCHGNESSLLDCSHDPWGENRLCRSSRKDAGIWCLTKGMSTKRSVHEWSDKAWKTKKSKITTRDETHYAKLQSQTSSFYNAQSHELKQPREATSVLKIIKSITPL